MCSGFFIVWFKVLALVEDAHPASFLFGGSIDKFTKSGIVCERWWKINLITLWVACLKSIIKWVCPSVGLVWFGCVLLISFRVLVCKHPKPTTKPLDILYRSLIINVSIFGLINKKSASPFFSPLIFFCSYACYLHA